MIDLDRCIAEGLLRRIPPSARQAEEQMKKLGDPLTMFDHLYAEMPPHLVLQKSALAEEIAANDKEVQHG